MNPPITLDGTLELAAKLFEREMRREQSNAEYADLENWKSYHQQLSDDWHERARLLREARGGLDDTEGR